jgi:hypothetical protein
MHRAARFALINSLKQLFGHVPELFQGTGNQFPVLHVSTQPLCISVEDFYIIIHTVHHKFLQLDSSAQFFLSFAVGKIREVGQRWIIERICIDINCPGSAATDFVEGGERVRIDRVLEGDYVRCIGV